jgi:hypothetical protein
MYHQVRCVLNISYGEKPENSYEFYLITLEIHAIIIVDFYINIFTDKHYLNQHFVLFQTCSSCNIFDIYVFKFSIMSHKSYIILCHFLL